MTHSAIDLLKQLSGILDKLNDKQYNSALELLSNSSIGAHVRHTLEFFICLIEGAESETINYDTRKRDTLLETDRLTAIKAIDVLSTKIKTLKTDRRVILESETGSNLIMSKMESSIGRELWYTIEHAVHHMAIIKIGIKSIDTSFRFPDNFGVASSTIRYQLTGN